MNIDLLCGHETMIDCGCRVCARNEALEEAVRVCEIESMEDRLCPEGNTGHDVRWCATCESMSDEASVLAEKIRTLIKP